MGAGKFALPRQVCHEAIHSLSVQYIGHQRPVGSDPLGVAEGAVAVLVVEETALVVPQLSIDIVLECQRLGLIVLDLLPPLYVEAHLEELIGGHDLLEIGVEPDHVTVGVDRIVPVRHAWHIVHPGPPATAPVGAVAPGAIEPQPVVVAAEHREDAMQSLEITILMVVDHLAPGEQVGTRGGRVVSLEAVGAVRLDLPADESVGVLFGVEIVKRPLEGEESVSVAGKHQDEAVVPHEEVPIIGRVNISGDKARSGVRLTNVVDSYPPGIPVHPDLLLVSLPDRRGEDRPCFVK